MKNTVIYHSADFDGLFCREIARRFLPDAELIGWNFGDNPVPIPPEGTVYVMDLPVDRVFGVQYGQHGMLEKGLMDPDLFQRLVWIDHHKTSIDTHPRGIPGYRIDGVAACRLAWQWFTHDYGPNNPNCLESDYDLPQKEHFITREVSEPLAVRLAGEYDVWDKRDQDAEMFQYVIRLVDLESDSLQLLLESDELAEKATQDLVSYGILVQAYQKNMDAKLVKSRSYRVDWEGLNWIVLNTGRFNSLTFAALDVPETGHDALLGYMFNGKVWMVSLYHAKHRTDLDLSEIAKRYGGGGHRGACGFTCKILPFLFTHP